MNPDENNEPVEDKLSLSEYLVPATPEIKEMKSIYEIEYEYSDYLHAIEFSIADYHYNENRKVTDKDVISALKNIKENHDKAISFFEKALEKEIVKSLIEPLEYNLLTDHEFTLVLDYVLWVIDNRSWIEDKQAYVKWITYALDFFSEREEKKYKNQFKKFARKMGVSAAQIDMLLLKRNEDDFFDDEDFFGEGGLFDDLEQDDIFKEDRTADDLETGFFLMNDDEKFDFLMDKGPDYVELVQDYVVALAGKNEFEKIQEFYDKFNEKHENFFPLHFIVGSVYLNSDPALAVSYFEKTLKATEEAEDFPPEMRKELKKHMDILTSLLLEEAAEQVEENKMNMQKRKKASKEDSERRTKNQTI
ncbi:MAG: hypothetical protein QM426_04940 [Euryarchaeota archaeon]|nr:hypothetical protein [Euryarchaeota archaeon]